MLKVWQLKTKVSFTHSGQKLKAVMKTFTHHQENIQAETRSEKVATFHPGHPILTNNTAKSKRNKKHKDHCH